MTSHINDSLLESCDYVVSADKRLFGSETDQVHVKSHFDVLAEGTDVSLFLYRYFQQYFLVDELLVEERSQRVLLLEYYSYINSAISWPSLKINNHVAKWRGNRDLRTLTCRDCLHKTRESDAKTNMMRKRFSSATFVMLPNFSTKQQR